MVAHRLKNLNFYLYYSSKHYMPLDMSVWLGYLITFAHFTDCLSYLCFFFSFLREVGGGGIGILEPCKWLYLKNCFYCFQPTDNVEICQFLLHDEARWKSMSRDAIMSVCGATSTPLWPQFPPLSAPTVDSVLASNDLEQQLRILVTEHRRVSSYIWLAV